VQMKNSYVTYAFLLYKFLHPKLNRLGLLKMNFNTFLKSLQLIFTGKL